MTSLPASLAKLTRALGYTATRVGRAVLLTKGPGVHVQELDATTWLVTEPGAPRRRAIQIGTPAARTHLVTRARAAYRQNGRVQRGLAAFLGDAQLAHTFEALDINCVLDVGANRGQFARRIRSAGYQGRIVSFEPLKQFVAMLEEASADDPDWRVVPAALGEADGEAEIHASESSLSSLLPSSEFGRAWSDKLQRTHAETIAVRRLDGLLDEVTAGLDDPRVFLKLDTQGFDLFAFRGAGDRIADILGLQSEVCCVPLYDGMPRFTEQVAEYEAAGFELTGMFPVALHAATLRVIEYDAVMVRTAAVVNP